MIPGRCSSIGYIIGWQVGLCGVQRRQKVCHEVNLEWYEYSMGHNALAIAHCHALARRLTLMVQLGYHMSSIGWPE